jgi:REP element-mobilizing transposase RayT
MTYWRLHYHLIWGTFERQLLLTPDREQVFYGVLYDKAKELGLKIHAAGNVSDHVHVVVSIPPNLSVADCVKHIKGASAFAINHMPNIDRKFKWQEGYAALSVGDRSLEMVMEYAARQKEHHGKGIINAVYEQIDE